MTSFWSGLKNKYAGFNYLQDLTFLLKYTITLPRIAYVINILFYLVMCSTKENVHKSPFYSNNKILII